MVAELRTKGKHFISTWGWYLVMEQFGRDGYSAFAKTQCQTYCGKSVSGGFCVIVVMGIFVRAKWPVMILSTVF